MRIAAEVGSDLPLFLIGGTVLGVGRGEEVYPLPDLPRAARGGDHAADWRLDSPGLRAMGCTGHARNCRVRRRIDRR